MKIRSKHLALAFSALIAMNLFWQAPANAADTAALGQAFDTLHWIAYSPLNYNPDQGVFPNAQQIRADLEVLKANGFGGIVTYGCNNTLANEFTDEASKLGFKIIIGVWDPLSAEELNNAVNCAKNPNVLAVCIGNERLMDKYKMPNPAYCYTLPQLKSALDSVRSRTGKPVTTSQQVKSYTEQDLIDACDFEFPTIHPYWEAVHDHKPALFDAKAGSDWTVEKWAAVKSRSNGKIVVAKEVGFPTQSDQGNCSEQKQADYYVHLTKSPMGKGFCYFEAYDQNWKRHNPTEPHWGLFRTDRKPKPAMAAIKGVW